MSSNVKKTQIASGYKSFLEQLKVKVKQSQLKASIAVNSELIKLYWDIGKSIVEKQEEEGWKAQIIEKLCKDLQNAFPGLEGFSRANIFNMRSFYLAYPKVQQGVGFLNKLPVIKIPWGHNILIITKIKNSKERLWYAEQVIEEGLSRRALEDWIKSEAYKRHGKAVNNFADRLPKPQSILAQELLKDPYNFDFLALATGYRETELEQGLIDHIQKMLLELGKGFAFVGRQYHLEIAGEDYYIDLLFYHILSVCSYVTMITNLRLSMHCVISTSLLAFQGT